MNVSCFYTLKRPNILCSTVAIFVISTYNRKNVPAECSYVRGL